MDDFTTPPTTVVVARSGPGPMVRIGLLGILVAALIATAILAFGLSTQPTGTLAAGAPAGSSGTSSTGAVPALNGGFPGGPGGPDGGPGFGRGFRDVSITAISGNDISLHTEDGWTRTITVDSGTTYSKAGQTIALSDLGVGDQIGLRQTRESDGSYTIDSIVVILPHAGGEVTAVSGSTITVKAPDGSTVTININGTTSYDVNGKSAGLADVKTGMFLVAEGTKNADGSLTATRVRAADPAAFRHHEHGFRNGGPGAPDTDPDATVAPSATGSAG